MSSEHSPARQKRFLRPRGAAEYLDLAESTLAKMRLRGDGPIYSKAGPRIVVYDAADLDAWLCERKRRSTSEEILTREVS